MMAEGQRMRFWFPESLAYQGKGDGPRGMLVFDIELVKIQ
jgi:FKBP-type peptidyl-prolyl cis-trans isomerase